MGSLRLPAVLEIYESKRHHLSGDRVGVVFAVNRRKLRGDVVRCCGIGVGCRGSGDYHDGRKQIAVHGSDITVGPHSATETVEEFKSSRVDNAALVRPSLVPKNAIPNMGKLSSRVREGDAGIKSKRKIWNRVAGMNKSSSRKVDKSKNVRSSEYVSDTHGLETLLSAIAPESSVEHCNSILKTLEKTSDEKTMLFFEWMKKNGKLKQNAAAYNLALRALARKEDWKIAKMLLQEMTSDSDCELNSQVFNTLIYVCAKRGLVGWGARWFYRMLENRVQPNVATIGMLMGLYQKSRSLSHAESVFSHMRTLKLPCITGYSAMITIYTRVAMYDKSEEVIKLMEEDKVLPNLENWLVRLNAYSQQGKLTEAESVLKSMHDSGISPNIVAYNTLITGYGKVANVEAAQRLFQTLQSMGLKPDETTYRSMVEGFGRNDSYKEALRYYEELRRSGFQPNSSNFYTMINLQARHGDERGAVQTLKDMRAMGCQYSSILSSLLQAYERVGRVEKVPIILNASFYENILLDPTSCSILVTSYVQNSLLDDALQVLQEKRWKDSNFEDNLYHLLICSCKERGQYENAVKIYTLMPKSVANPNLHITCSMIDIYCAMNKYTDAEDLYLKLKASDVTFDMIAYSIVIRMYMKSGALKRACLVLDIMEKQKDIVPDKYLFLDMLRVYQQCSLLEKLANLYYWILRSGVKWDEAMYNCVINCCGHALPVDELARLFNDMMKCGYAANTITFNVMLDIYGKGGLLKKASNLFWMGRRQGLADVISYNTIIAAYGQSKKFKSMQYFVQRMQDAGHSVSLEAYNCMLDAYGKGDLLEEFDDVLQKMKEASCASDHYTYNIMINIYGKKGWIEEVSSVLAELREHGLEPDLYSYNTLIKAYGIAGMAEEAVNVVQEMRAKGIKPDRVTYTNLIVALQRNENFLEAVKWSLWMKQTGISN